MAWKDYKEKHPIKYPASMTLSPTSSKRRGRPPGTKKSTSTTQTVVSKKQRSTTSVSARVVDGQRLRCTQCKQNFISVQGFVNHTTYFHSDERHFNCTMCTKAYKYQSSLSLHIKNIHRKLYVIYICTFIPAQCCFTQCAARGVGGTFIEV